MPPSYVDIQRTAHLWIQQHGDDATAKAPQKVDEAQSKGDVAGADELREPQSRGHLMRFSAIAANMVCSPSGIHKVSAQEGDYENRRHSGDVYYRDRGHDVGIIEKIGAKRVTVRLIGPNGGTAILVPIARLHPNGPNRRKFDL